VAEVVVTSSTTKLVAVSGPKKGMCCSSFM